MRLIRVLPDVGESVVTGTQACRVHSDSFLSFKCEREIDSSDMLNTREAKRRSAVVRTHLSDA